MALNPYAAKLFVFFLIHLKLESQFPTSNDEKYVYLWKNVHLEFFIFWLTEYLSQTILWILVAYNLIWNLLETVYIKFQQHKG